MIAKIKSKQCRNRKITKEVIDRLIAKVQKGSSIYQAALSELISPSYMTQLRKQGEMCIDVQNDLDSLEVYYVQKLNQMRVAQIEHCFVNIIDSPRGHKGCEYILEKLYPAQFTSDGVLRDAEARITKLLDKMGVAANDEGS